MAKLAAPIIQETLPAFFKTQGVETALSIPFTMNSSVSLSQVSNFIIKLKTVSGKNYFLTQEAFAFDLQNMVISFRIPNDKINEGQYYKIQIAYIDYNNDVGNYSSVSVIKCTSKPSIYIDGLSSGKINQRQFFYTGVYDQENCEDITEKVLYYEFKLYDNKYDLIYSSKQQVHNSTNDQLQYKSTDVFYCPYDFEKEIIYYLQYNVITVNGLELSSPIYKLWSILSVEMDLKNIVIVPELNFNNGYIKISFQEETGKDVLKGSGSYIIQRGSSSNNYSYWENLFEFNLNNENILEKSFRDFTIEQGKEYRYALIQVNNYGVYSKRITQKGSIYSDFEDVFLSDGKRQLKVRFNTKVNNFKTDILEQKVDTIGHKYPYIIRNGEVAYKDFQISGLISKISDEESIFLSLDNLDSNDFETNLTPENYYYERQFKLEVLDWLNNGQSKLFRSPAEGNYIVQLMNISLTPTDSIGRMLHTFNCNAYEICEYSIENLEKLNFRFSYINEVNKYTKFFSSMTLDTLLQQYEDWIETAVYNDEEYYKISNNLAFSNFRIDNLKPGDKILLQLVNSNEILEIVIGLTGMYEAPAGTEILNVFIPKSAYYSKPVINYQLQEKLSSNLDYIKAISTSDIGVRQFDGPMEDLITKLTSIQSPSTGEYIINPKLTLTNLYGIRFYKKFDDEIYYKDEETGKWEWDNNFNYDLKLKSPKLAFDADQEASQIYEPTKANSLFIYKLDENDLSKSVIDMSKTEYYEITNPKLLTDDIKIDFGSNVMCDIQFKIVEKEFSIETENKNLRKLKAKYNQSLQQYSENPDDEELRIKKDQNYYDFILELSANLKEDEENG